MPLGAGALFGVGAGLSGVSSGLGMLGQGMNYRNNKRLAKYQYDLNMQAWREQTAYNSPAAQMARLTEAGLNPHLVYGNGNVANAADAPPQYEAPRSNFDTRTNISEGIASAVNMQMMQAQVRNIDSDIALKRQQMLDLAAQTAGRSIKNAQSQFDLDLARDLRANTLEASKLNLESIRAGIDRTKSDIALNDVRSGLFRSQAAQADAMAKRMNTLTPAEYRLIESRTGLNRTQVGDIVYRWRKVSQDLKEGKSRIALQEAERTLKQYNIQQWDRGINPNITNPAAMLLDFVINLAGRIEGDYQTQ